MYHHTGKSTEETFAFHELKSQAIRTIRVPPKIANLEQLAITGKEVLSLSFFGHHVAILEFKSSKQCKYKNVQSQGFMAIFC